MGSEKIQALLILSFDSGSKSCCLIKTLKYESFQYLSGFMYYLSASVTVIKHVRPAGEVCM